MAVDANILINERAREEARKTDGVISALETGFRRAYRTIVDANATTLIKMLILFAIGTGAIRGFAITISMGILISMFTAIVLVRLLISYWLKRTRPKSLRIGTRRRLLPEGTAIPFMRARYSGLIVSAVISLASLGLAYAPGLKDGRGVCRRRRYRGARSCARRSGRAARQTGRTRSWTGSSAGNRLAQRCALAPRASARR